MAIDDLSKLKQDVGFLSTASPQQLNTVGQLLQNGHHADAYEPLAFLIANNMQREMRQPNPQAPQQTILQQRLAELQGQENPMMGGIPNVGPNQMALQQTAMQNPNMAGIAAAPENTGWTPQQLPPAQQGLGSIPGAATGGLVAFAEGGEVRGFAGGGRNFAPLTKETLSKIRDILGEQRALSPFEDQTPNPDVAEFETRKAIQNAPKQSSMSSLYGPSGEALGPELDKLNQAIKWQNLSGEVPTPVAPEQSLAERMAQSSAKPATPVSEMARGMTKGAAINPETTSEMLKSPWHGTESSLMEDISAAKQGIKSLANRGMGLGKSAFNMAVETGPLAVGAKYAEPAQELMDVGLARAGINKPHINMPSPSEIAQNWREDMPTWMPGAESDMERLRREYAGKPIPETGTSRFPEEEEETEETGETKMVEPTTGHIINPKVKPNKEATKGVKAKSPIEQHQETVNKAAGSDASSNAFQVASHPPRGEEATADVAESPADAISELIGLRGGAQKLSPELLKKYTDLEDKANKDKWLSTIASGLGGLFSAQTPFFGQALGKGLLDATAAYQHGAKGEEEAGLRSLGVQVGQEQADQMAQQAGYKDWMDIQKLKAKGLSDMEIARYKANERMNQVRYAQEHSDWRTLVGAGNRQNMTPADWANINADAETIIKGQMERSNINKTINPEAYAKKEAEVRQNVYQQLGISNSPLSSLGTIGQPYSRTFIK